MYLSKIDLSFIFDGCGEFADLFNFYRKQLKVFGKNIYWDDGKDCKFYIWRLWSVCRLLMFSFNNCRKVVKKTCVKQDVSKNIKIKICT